ncbi:hypothetical protein P170DRAFT_393722 [Aspergillus steynii IBT 23096]|uniref:UBC core domain-containing protein n=1 Tax=Aspergillus steynii IBT 23096 TaxID=1392250 RepID=A0A2I2FT09_9EURO|nr:uncharacterized protein P170DRAFT_393722 [Aspergillus steynii IBT 23096]PLB43775.1 hypothetical protein P170DRAFT_393722 [Aspergillus steynii IBT 23096]
MPSGLRRLAADHAALHEDLPPNYLHPSDDSGDDLTQLTTLLAGPQGTPYSQGLWRLHLKMPEDYPKSPPKATFRTRIWHPNVEESTGAVCVDTLKRDWKQTLTLKDVLITISCLLIYPNPDSALNSAAGSLLQENYEAFARQAKLMTSIHAPVPADMKNAVSEAKLRGEDAGTVIPEQEDARLLRSRKNVKTQTLTMKKTTAPTITTPTPPTTSKPQPSPYQSDNQDTSDEEDDENQFDDTENDSPAPIFSDDEENLSAASKENDPSLSPSPVKFFSSSPRKNAFGKRPLSVLTVPVDYPDPSSAMGREMDSDGDTTDTDSDHPMTASEKNIAANYPSSISDPQYNDALDGSPQRKSPKLSLLHKGANSSGRVRDDLKIFEDVPPAGNTMNLDRQLSGDGKENHESSSSSSTGPKGLRSRKPLSTSFPSSILALSSTPTATIANACPALGAGPGLSTLSRPGLLGSRKVSGAGTMKKAKPRLGIRRL